MLLYSILLYKQLTVYLCTLPLIDCFQFRAFINKVNIPVQIYRWACALDYLALLFGRRMYPFFFFFSYIPDINFYQICIISILLMMILRLKSLILIRTNVFIIFLLQLVLLIFCPTLRPCRCSPMSFFRSFIVYTSKI